ncbi:hypothetical protein X771_30675 [Mesorhizobium sp. LSJC277A00]|nr:hypothetical protein X771_30675 [Mesorhizobium sp. LSJC277A00]
MTDMGRFVTGVCKARTPIGVREFDLEDDTTPEQASSIIQKDDARQSPVIGTDETAKQIVALLQRVSR